MSVRVAGIPVNMWAEYYLINWSQNCYHDSNLTGDSGVN